MNCGKIRSAVTFCFSLAPLWGITACSNAVSLTGGKQGVTGMEKPGKAESNSGSGTKDSGSAQEASFENASSPENVSGSYLTDASLLCADAASIGQPSSDLGESFQNISCYMGDKFGVPSSLAMEAVDINVTFADGSVLKAPVIGSTVQGVSFFKVVLPKEKFKSVAKMDLDLLQITKTQEQKPLKKKRKAAAKYVDLAKILASKPPSQPTRAVDADKVLPSCATNPMEPVEPSKGTFFGAVGCVVSTFEDAFIRKIVGPAVSIQQANAAARPQPEATKTPKLP